MMSKIVSLTAVGFNSVPHYANEVMSWCYKLHKLQQGLYLRSELQVCVPLLHTLVHPAMLHTLLLHLLTATSQFLSALLQVLSLQRQLLYLRSTHTNTGLSLIIHILILVNKATLTLIILELTSGQKQSLKSSSLQGIKKPAHFTKTDGSKYTVYQYYQLSADINILI